MKTGLSFLLGVVATLLFQAFSSSEPESENQEIVAEEVVNSQDCAPPRVVEKVIEKKVLMAAPQKESIENSRFRHLKKKMNIEIFDSEFKRLETQLEDLVQRELAKGVPQGEIVHREFFENGDRLVAEEAFDGTRISKVYGPSGVLKEAHWKDERSGQFQRRTYNQNKVVGVEFGAGPTDGVSISYTPEGAVIEKTFLDPKTGDMIGTSYDENGRPTAKWRDTKEGHMLTIWQDQSQDL